MHFSLIQSCPDCVEIADKILHFNQELAVIAKDVLNVDISDMTLSQVTQLLNDNVDRLDGKPILERHIDLYNSILAHSHTEDGSVVVRH